MADTVIVQRRPRWPLVLGIIILAFILLLIVLYFVVSSSAFFKGVILPRVSKSMNADVTVADASIHPFSGAVLRNVKVQTTGAAPLLTAPEVRIAYNLGAILRGNYDVREVALTSPVIQIIKNPDGTSNLDPLMKKRAQANNAPSGREKPSKTEQVDLRRLTLSNGTIVMAQNYNGGHRDLTQVSNVNLTLTNLANGQTGGLDLAANIAMDNHPPSPGTNSTLHGAAKGNFAFTMSQDLKPVKVNGNAHLDIQNAGGSMSDFAGLTTLLNCDVTPTDIKQVALRFEKNGGNFGGVNLSGPFDMAKTEGHLKLEVTPIGRQVLNLFGAKNGIDFGQTMLSSSNELDFANGGNLVTVSGQFNANKMTLTRQNQTTPALEVHSDYHLTVNRQNNSALLQTFNLNGTQNGQPLLHADLTKPMTIALGAGSNAAVGDSTLKLTTNLNLADWKAILGTNATSGLLNSTLTVLSQQGGKQLTVDFNSRLANVSANVGGTQLQQASMNLQGHLVEQQASKTLAGNVALSNFNGRYGNSQFQDYGAKMDLNVVMNKPVVEIKNVSGNVFQGSNPGGSFQLTGNYNQDEKTGQLALKLVDLNQNALRPFLSSLLGNKTLDSVALNATTTAHYNANGQGSVKSDLRVENLIVRDPTAQTPPAPLNLKMTLDASMNKKIAQVNQLQVVLTPTTRAPNNQVTLSGQMDLSHSNAIGGSLKLAADALDVTHYYDIYSKKSAAKPPPSEMAPAQPTQAAAQTEPPAKNLPFQNFTLDASIGHLYLHEVDVANFQTTARIDNNRVTLNPCQFALNGGPVNATVALDLGVPGYQYNIAFSGKSIPLQPLADTFSPQYSGKAKGDAFVDAQIKGAGTTGASMQRNLSGQGSLSLTNANIQIAGHKLKAVLTPIAAALQVPELAKSPITWVKADVTIGNGQINITQFKAAGPALNASSQGTVTIADVLSNSPINNLPVNLAIATPLASKSRLTTPNTNPNASGYVNLGKVATVGGTIGAPQARVDYAAISLLTTRALGGIIGGKTGNIMQGAGGALGGILGGQGQQGGNQQQQPGQPPANQPGTNQPPSKSGNPFDLLHKVIP